MAKDANHHWFPVGLQQYWMDSSGNVSIIRPDGKIEVKRARRNKNKIGVKRHAHTLHKGDEFWEYSFEYLFNIDAIVHDIISRCQFWNTGIGRLKILWNLLKRFRVLRKMPKSISNVAVYEAIPAETHSDFVKFACSIVLRSPRTHYLFGGYSWIDGAAASQEVAKLNLHQAVRSLFDIFNRTTMPMVFITIIHPNRGSFLIGDGFYESFAHTLVSGRFSGEALVPLTPEIALFLSSDGSRHGGTNLATIIADPWMVSGINDLTQIHSERFLAFTGKSPQIISDYSSGEFRPTLEIPFVIEQLREISDHAPALRAEDSFIIGGRRRPNWSRF